jgi:hypothetical protein
MGEGEEPSTKRIFLHGGEGRDLLEGGGGFKSNFCYVLLASLLLLVYLLPLYSVFLPVITPAFVDGVRLRSYTGGEGGGGGYCMGTST